MFFSIFFVRVGRRACGESVGGIFNVFLKLFLLRKGRGDAGKRGRRFRLLFRIAFGISHLEGAGEKRVDVLFRVFLDE